MNITSSTILSNTQSLDALIKEEEEEEEADALIEDNKKINTLFNDILYDYVTNQYTEQFIIELHDMYIRKCKTDFNKKSCSKQVFKTIYKASKLEKIICENKRPPYDTKVLPADESNKVLSADESNKEFYFTNFFKLITLLVRVKCTDNKTTIHMRHDTLHTENLRNILDRYTKLNPPNIFEYIISKLDTEQLDTKQLDTEQLDNFDILINKVNMDLNKILPDNNIVLCILMYYIFDYLKKKNTTHLIEKYVNPELYKIYNNDFQNKFIAEDRTNATVNGKSFTNCVETTIYNILINIHVKEGVYSPPKTVYDDINTFLNTEIDNLKIYNASAWAKLLSNRFDKCVYNHNDEYGNYELKSLYIGDVLNKLFDVNYTIKDDEHKNKVIDIITQREKVMDFFISKLPNTEKDIDEEWVTVKSLGIKIEISDGHSECHPIVELFGFDPTFYKNVLFYFIKNKSLNNYKTKLVTNDIIFKTISVQEELQQLPKLKEGQLYYLYNCSSYYNNILDTTVIKFPIIIGDSAFKNSTVTNLVIGDNVKAIETSAFSDTSITGLEIKNGVETIGCKAFYNCRGLTGELKIPGSIKTIGNGAFVNTHITHVIFDSYETDVKYVDAFNTHVTYSFKQLPIESDIVVTGGKYKVNKKNYIKICNL